MLIAIDHGNKFVKVPNHAPFTSGLQESDSPPFGGETLKYQGKYYTLSEKRIPYHRDKTEDERFFVLTLFAIAYAAGGGPAPRPLRGPAQSLFRLFHRARSRAVRIPGQNLFHLH